MTELKTLKDLKNSTTECCSKGAICDLCSRAEAVKYWKFYRDAEEPVTERFIEDFFNLTEEDLKEENDENN